MNISSVSWLNCLEIKFGYTALYGNTTVTTVQLWVVYDAPFIVLAGCFLLMIKVLCLALCWEIYTDEWRLFDHVL